MIKMEKNDIQKMFALLYDIKKRLIIIEKVIKESGSEQMAD
jgi:hypothetical protein